MLSSLASQTPILPILNLAFNGKNTERVVKSVFLITFDFDLLAFDCDVVVLNAYYAFT